MLLNVDGLNKPWDSQHIPTSNHESSFGNLEFDDLPLAMQRLFLSDKIRAYDTSTLVMQVRRQEEQEELLNNLEAGRSDVRVVRQLSLNYFHGRLVEHFEIQFKAGKIKWPHLRGKQLVTSDDVSI
jgi:hypothetical protein